MVHPIDTIRVRMSFSEQQMTLRSCTRELVATEGHRGLFRGLTASITSAVPFSGINLATFMYGKQLYKDYYDIPLLTSPPTSVLLALGVGSTLSAQLVSYPMYSVKVNLQAGLETSSLDCMRRLYREHGVPGLYRGMSLNFVKAAPAVCVTFTTYTKAKEWLGIPCPPPPSHL